MDHEPPELKKKISNRKAKPLTLPANILKCQTFCYSFREVISGHVVSIVLGTSVLLIIAVMVVVVVTETAPFILSITSTKLLYKLQGTATLGCLADHDKDK